MAKRIILFFLFLFLVVSIYPEDQQKKPDRIEQKLAEMNIKKYTMKENFSKMISRLYLFTDNNMTGGIGVSRLEKYNIDFFVVAIKYEKYTLIKYAEVMDENALEDKNMMKELIAAFTKMNGQKVETSQDAITQATIYTKKLYIQIKLIATAIARELENKK